MQSLWSATAHIPEFPVLKENLHTDVLIIGGGMAGVLCARLLTDAGVACVLLEGARIGRGTTANTTAKITAQHALIYQKLLTSFGAERARMYYEANRRAIERYRELARSVDCGLETKPAFTYSTNDRQQIERELDAAVRLNIPASFVEAVPLPIEVEGAIRFDNQAQFHPLRFLAGISGGLPIYERSFVRSIKDSTAYTDSGSVTADAILIATHFPFINRTGGYPLKLYQHRSYVIAIDGAPDVQGMYIDAAENGLSFRNYENLLLIGGGDHRTGKQGGNWNALFSFARANYLSAIEKYHWAAQDCMSLDQVPYIGRYSGRSQNWYVATGFNKWGMTGSMVAAMLLCDQLTGKHNDCAEVFKPSRSVLHKQLLANALESTANLLKPVAPRCTHLGCALKWNSAERSWDCACHGSRFDEEGKVLENPAMKPISPQKNA